MRFRDRQLQWEQDAESQSICAYIPLKRHWLAYGSGDTRGEALRDLVVTLVDVYRAMSSDTSVLTPGARRYLSVLCRFVEAPLSRKDRATLKAAGARRKR